jgi:hypothetical protein
MISANLQGIADLVIRRAQRQGSLAPLDIRDELSQAGVPDTYWKEVVALARPALRFRQGRYYYTTPVSERVRQEQQQQRSIHRAVRHLVRQHRAAGQVERRGHDRVDFIQPVKVRTEDDREFNLLSRDLSATGIRLIGTRRLLGQKVRVLIPQSDGGTPLSFLVRILWTCAVGDDLFENGGTFVEVAPAARADKVSR